MAEWILSLAVSFMQGYPAFSTFLMIVGILRVAMKPLMVLIQSVVEKTETKVDDTAVSSFVNSEVYKAIVFVIDYLASIKLPRK